MCDYSLAGLPSRLAVEGEELVVHKFRTGSKGLACPQDLCMSSAQPERKNWWERIKAALADTPPTPAAPAVCIPPGAQLVLKDIPKDLQRRWSVNAQEQVFFVQTSAMENNYRDAVKFHNGAQSLLQELREGMRVEVVSLGAAEHAGAPRETVAVW
jgi:hypothetical protein